MRITLGQKEITAGIALYLSQRGLAQVNPEGLVIEFTQTRRAGAAGLTAVFDIPELDGKFDASKLPTAAEKVQGATVDGNQTTAQAARIFRESGGEAGGPLGSVTLDDALAASGQPVNTDRGEEFPNAVKDGPAAFDAEAAAQEQPRQTEPDAGKTEGEIVQEVKQEQAAETPAEAPTEAPAETVVDEPAPTEAAPESEGKSLFS